MNKAYPERINWQNYTSTATPLGATNLNKMDSALYTIDGRVCDMDVTKAKQSDLLECLKNVDYNTTSGIFTFTFQNGSVKTVDLNVEKIPVSFSMSATGVITMKTSDGTEYTADVGSLIKTYTFNDGNIVDFTVTTDTNGNKTVTADIKNGSITGAKLQPNYLADITAQATTAQNAATAASTSESKVKTSETNAKTSETNASNSAISALSSSGSAKTSETNAKTSETNASRSETNAKTSENKAKTSETNAKSSEDNAFSYKNQAEASKTAAATSELNASTSATTSSEKALVSEGYSSGTQNGVPVDSSSPYYQNNAKYYKDQAQSSAFAQSDWNESVTTKSAYILNKPFKTIGANLSVDPDGVLSADAQSITVDSELSDTSENPVQNKVVKSAIDSKADSSSIPTKISDLTNDSDFVVDANYVHIDVDNALSDTSENPVQNKIIKAAIDAATPSDYGTVKSQVTTNKNDITSIKSDLSEYVSDGYLGKNFIESIEQGAYTESGDKQTSSTRCRVENKIPCAKGDKFVFSSELSSAQIYVRVYDASGTLLDHFDWVTNFTVVSNDASYFLVMIRKSDNSNITPTELSKAQIEYGTVATDYVPYAPSNFEITSIKKGLSDLDMLGWEVPKDCPLHNSVSGNVFTQKIGRVRLSDLSWEKADTNRFYSIGISDSKTVSSLVCANAYCSKYKVVDRNSIADKQISISSNSSLNYINIVDSSYTDATTLKNSLSGVYLYYELSTPISKTIDGNEAITSIKESLSDAEDRGFYSKNLLNPTLATTTLNGVTCTNNGDGTYTLNGTATANAEFWIGYSSFTKSKTYKIISGTGTQQTDAWTSSILYIHGSSDLDNEDIGYTGNPTTIGSGYSTFTTLKNFVNVPIRLYVCSGYTCNNLVFKPMIVDETKFPNVTYADYEQYVPSNKDVKESLSEIYGTSDAYNRSISYTVGAMCLYNNALWKCILACKGQTPTEGTYWTKISLASVGENSQTITDGSVNDNLKYAKCGKSALIRIFAYKCTSSSWETVGYLPFNVPSDSYFIGYNSTSSSWAVCYASGNMVQVKASSGASIFGSLSTFIVD